MFWLKMISLEKQAKEDLDEHKRAVYLAQAVAAKINCEINWHFAEIARLSMLIQPEQKK